MFHKGEVKIGLPTPGGERKKKTVVGWRRRQRQMVVGEVRVGGREMQNSKCGGHCTECVYG